MGRNNGSCINPRENFRERKSGLKNTQFFFEDGGCRFCLFLKNIDLSDEQINKIMEISGVEECGSRYFQDYSVVFYLESIQELTPQRIAQAKAEIRQVLRGY